MSYMSTGDLDASTIKNAIRKAIQQMTSAPPARPSQDVKVNMEAVTVAKEAQATADAVEAAARATRMKIALGVGAVALAGGVFWFSRRKK